MPCRDSRQMKADQKSWWLEQKVRVVGPSQESEENMAMLVERYGASVRKLHLLRKHRYQRRVCVLRADCNTQNIHANVSCTLCRLHAEAGPALKIWRSKKRMQGAGWLNDSINYMTTLVAVCGASLRRQHLPRNHRERRTYSTPPSVCFGLNKEQKKYMKMLVAGCCASLGRRNLSRNHEDRRTYSKPPSVCYGLITRLKKYVKMLVAGCGASVQRRYPYGWRKGPSWENNRTQNGAWTC